MSKKHNRKVGIQKEKEKRQRKIGTIFLVLIGIFLIPLIISQVYKRNKLLEEKSEFSIAKVYDIKSTTKGVTTRQTLAFIEYYVEGIKYEGTTPIYPNTKINNCYEIKYVISNPKIFEVNFNNASICEF